MSRAAERRGDETSGATTHEVARKTGRRKKESPSGTFERRSFIAQSSEMRRVSDALAHAIAVRASVLVTGERGTGKDHVAQLIHDGAAVRSQPFIVVRCAALTEALLESELCSPTDTLLDRSADNAFQRAHGGTLLLDEVDALSPVMQVKLLASLHRIAPSAGGSSSVRVIASATSPSELRPALRQRLGEIEIALPPLRQRREDILPLAKLFLERAAGGEKLTLTRAAVTALETHDWPGNVGQLEKNMTRAVAAAHGGEVSLDAVSELTWSAPPPELSSLSYREMLAVTRDRSTRDYLCALLVGFEGDVPRAAAHAQVERPSFYRLLRRYQVEPAMFRTQSPSR